MFLIGRMKTSGHWMKFYYHLNCISRKMCKEFVQKHDGGDWIIGDHKKLISDRVCHHLLDFYDEWQ